MEFGNYLDEQMREENTFKDVDHYIKVATNKKPEIGKTEITDVTRTTAIARIQGIDEEGEKLIYKIHYGIDKERLEKTLEKVDVLAGTEEIIEIKDLTPYTKYYYKVEISDELNTIFSDIGNFQTKQANTSPSIPNATVKYRGTSRVEIAVQSTDDDGDELEYELRYDKGFVSATSKVAKAKGKSGEEVIIYCDNLEDDWKYNYQVTVYDGTERIQGPSKYVGTLCAANEYDCNEATKCTTCSGSGKHTYNFTSANISGTPLDTREKCPYCGNIRQWNDWTVKCNGCGYSVSGRSCTYNTCILSRVSNTHTCKKCSGYGNFSCKHGKRSSHKYCSHGYTVIHDRWGEL